MTIIHSVKCDDIGCPVSAPAQINLGTGEHDYPNDWVIVIPPERVRRVRGFHSIDCAINALRSLSL